MTTEPPVEIHRQPWSVVYRIQTSSETLFFKALCPALRHEPRLTRQLAAWQPDLIQPVMEIEDSKGWMLMPDGGMTLRQQLARHSSLEYWQQILPAYARFQIGMIEHNYDLLGLGVVNRSLNRLPEAFVNLLSDNEVLRINQEDGLTIQEAEQLNILQPGFKQLCQKLASYGIPETLQHDDFHDGNIFYRPGHFRFFDWAESFISHPFFSLVVTLRSIAYRFSLQENAVELNVLRDLYLREWQSFAPLADLQQAYQLAMIVGRLNRALTWNQVVSTLPEPYRSQEADAVPGWLKLFLEIFNTLP